MILLKTLNSNTNAPDHFKRHFINDRTSIHSAGFSHSHRRIFDDEPIPNPLRIQVRPSNRGCVGADFSAYIPEQGFNHASIRSGGHHQGQNNKWVKLLCHTPLTTNSSTHASTYLLTLRGYVQLTIIDFAVPTQLVEVSAVHTPSPSRIEFVSFNAIGSAA